MGNQRRKKNKTQSHARTHARTHAHTHALTHTNTHTIDYTRTYTDVHTRINTQTHKQLHAHILTYLSYAFPFIHDICSSVCACVSVYIYCTVPCTGVLLLALWLPHQHGGRPRRSDVPLPSSLVHTALQARRPPETMVLLPDGQLCFILPRPSDGPLLWLLAFIHRFVQITVVVNYIS